MFHPWPLVEYPIRLLHLGKAVFAYLGFVDPVVISVSLFHIEGYALARLADGHPGMRQVHYYGPRPWRKRHLEVPPAQTPSLDDPDRVARNVVDRIWQAFGYDQAPLFDDEGNFRP